MIIYGIGSLFQLLPRIMCLHSQFEADQTENDELLLF